MSVIYSRQKTNKRSGVYFNEPYVEVVGPDKLKNATAVLPKVDTDCKSASVLVAPSGTPFDNGATDYLVCTVGVDGVNGARMMWGASADLSSLTNAAAVATLAGGADINYPCLTVDAAGYSNWKTAVKNIWYMDTSVANTDSSRLRYALLDNDDNKAATGDTTVNTGLCSATATDWNNKLLRLCYVAVNSNASNSGMPWNYKYLMLAVFSNGAGTTTNYAFIYGSTLAGLALKKLNLSSDQTAKTDTLHEIVPMTRTMGRPLADKALNGFPMMVTTYDGSANFYTFLGITNPQGHTSVTTRGDSFFTSTFATYTCRYFGYRPGEALNKFVILLEEDDGSTNTEQNTYFFPAYGSAANRRGAATVV